MVDQKKAYAYAIIVVLIWSTVASVFKISLIHVDNSTPLVVGLNLVPLILSATEGYINSRATKKRLFKICDTVFMVLRLSAMLRAISLCGQRLKNINGT